MTSAMTKQQIIDWRRYLERQREELTQRIEIIDRRIKELEEAENAPAQKVGVTGWYSFGAEAS